MVSPVGSSRLYHPAAYDVETLPPTLWRESAGDETPDYGPVADAQCDVAIIGGGITGLSAALHLARDHGIAAVVLEAGCLGWGASGRNGGFCVPGGAGHDEAALAKRYGREEAERFTRLSRNAVSRVQGLLTSESIDADVMPGGEVLFAHGQSALEQYARRRDAQNGPDADGLVMLTPKDLAARGMNAAIYQGALWERHGFGLHPLKYTRGLAAAASRYGSQISERTPVLNWKQSEGWHELQTSRGTVRCRKVGFTTGAYQPEGLASALAGRILPVQSNILVTRPLTLAEQQAQGWTSFTPCSDSYRLLHYFRLLPDGRFLFGGRGGLSAAPRRAHAFRQRLTRDFHLLFPAWKDVEITHFWSGLVDLAADLVPHCALIGKDGSAFQACAYHGSGVAMGTELGAQLASLIAYGTAPDLPVFLNRGPPRFGFPALRKQMLAVALSYFAMRDAIS